MFKKLFIPIIITVLFINNICNAGLKSVDYGTEQVESSYKTNYTDNFKDYNGFPNEYAYQNYKDIQNQFEKIKKEYLNKQEIYNKNKTKENKNEFNYYKNIYNVMGKLLSGYYNLNYNTNYIGGNIWTKSYNDIKKLGENEKQIIKNNNWTYLYEENFYYNLVDYYYSVEGGKMSKWEYAGFALIDKELLGGKRNGFGKSIYIESGTINYSLDFSTYEGKGIKKDENTYVYLGNNKNDNKYYSDIIGKNTLFIYIESFKEDTLAEKLIGMTLPKQTLNYISNRYIKLTDKNLINQFNIQSSKYKLIKNFSIKNVKDKKGKITSTYLNIYMDKNTNYLKSSN